jgi:redox-sensitive bicupin YhaK (pirin superfamily)
LDKINQIKELGSINMKRLVGIQGNDEGHWVGNGFPVRTLFFYQQLGKEMSPFLMLDFIGPAEFAATTERKGVGTHPHRGFETVTIVYEGGVSHKDSTGQGGTIGPGEVQWMTAGSGILHQEFHSEDFARRGGILQMVQLWVNLPAKHKMTAPAYQGILNQSIPEIELSNSRGLIRVIAGEYEGQVGPAKTFTPMNVFDIRLKKGEELLLSATSGWNTSVVVLRGSLVSAVDPGVIAGDAKMLMFSQDGEEIKIKALEDSVALLLSGEPIDEPIVGHGPFVMNTREQINQAINDFNQGAFGSIEQV